MKKILIALERALKELSHIDRIGVAVSGGLDSMVLLEAVGKYVERNLAQQKKFLVLHMNHNLRAEESDLDEELVLRRAKELGLPFRSERIDWKKNRPSQALCREKREEFFQKAVGKNGVVLFAHHLDDQAETVFLRLLRGSGMEGLRGMRPIWRWKVRPFLSFEKEFLRQQAREWGVRWREDASNQRDKYERNWVRNKIFPLLEGKRKGFARRLAQLAEEMQSVELPLREVSGFPITEKVSVFFAGEVRQLESRNLKNTFSLNRKHTQDLMQLLQKREGKLTAQGVRFTLSQNVLLVERGDTFSNETQIEKANNKIRRVENALGLWQFQLGHGEEVLFQRDLQLGEKLKKMFQRERIPVFFRPLTPILIRNGSPALLFPRSGAPENRRETMWWKPSPLANWFIASLSSDA